MYTFEKFGYTDPQNVFIKDGFLEVVCPDCHHLNIISIDDMDYKFDKILRGCSEVYPCEECKGSMQILLYQHEWWVSFGVSPLQPIDNKYIIPNVGECICGACGKKFKNEDMLFVEKTSNNFLGPMCIDCAVIHYENMCKSKASGPVSVIPFLVNRRTYPIYTKDIDEDTLETKIQCPNCLALNEFEGVLEEEETFYFVCPNCYYICSIKLINSCESLNVQMHQSTS